MFNMFVIVIAALTTFFARSLAHGTVVERRIEGALSKIEERLENIVQTMEKLQNTRRPEGRFEQGAFGWNARRLEVIESKIERLEEVITSEVRRIDTNWTLLTFKHDFARDQLLRKIDAVHGQLHIRLARIEAQIDTSERKITEQIDHFAGRLARFQEAANSRHIETYDGLKSLINLKFTNFSQYLDEYQQLQAQGNNLELLLNATRYESQNSLRNILVQVGRLQSKSGDRTHDNDWGIDGKLDTIIEQQSAFLDSCYRIQSDEPQLESKISEILEKIVDVFQKDSVAGIKDIQSLEQVIKNQDTSIRRNLYTLAHNLGVLTKKATEYRDDVVQQVLLVRSDLEQLNQSLLTLPIINLQEDFSKWSVSSREVLEKLKETCSEEIIDKRFASLREQLEKFQMDLLKKLDSTVEELRMQNGSTTTTDQNVDSNLDAIIREIFGLRPNSTASDTGDAIIFEEPAELNCSAGILDIRSGKCPFGDENNEGQMPSSMGFNNTMQIDRRVQETDADAHADSKLQQTRGPN